MKAVRFAALAAALAVSGCATTGQAPAEHESHWYNPLTYHWAALNPLSWFGGSLQVTEQGVAGLNGSTLMSESAISQALNNDYQLRQGMRSEQGEVAEFWQALQDDKVKLIISGKPTVERIEVLDAAAESSSGSKIGDRFSDTFTKAFNNCKMVAGLDAHDVECQAPGSQHIFYVYSGKWHGPAGLMPSDDTLKSWTISKIVWQR